MSQRFRLEHVPGGRWPWRVVDAAGRLRAASRTRGEADVHRNFMERHTAGRPDDPITPDELAAAMVEGRFR